MRNARKTRRRGVRIGLPAALLAILVAALVAGCGSGSDSDTTGTASSGGNSGGGKLDVVGYSTPESVYTGALEPAFEKTPAGQGVTFSNSFGASGDQSRAVASGQPASIVHFAQGGDMERLVEEGEIVSKDWDQQPYGGIGADSVVAIVVRKGNPEGIRSFADLVSKDVEIVTPNPASSGSARWNIMAVYGSALEEGKTPDQALADVRTILEKAVAQPGSARDAGSVFNQGQGDVLLAYENEAIRAVEEGEDVEYVIPPSTILIETPLAATTNAPQPAAQDYLDFNWSDEGQRIWADHGYRPVNPKLVDTQKFPTPKKLFKIAKFGGWPKVKEEFFEEGTGSVTKIENELGVPTSG